MKNARKLFKNKKGFNDIFIITIITFIFFGTSIMIPFVNAEFSTSFDTFDRDNLETLVKADAENVSTFSAFNVLITMVKLAFFDWDGTLNLPFWLEGIYTILGIVLILTIGRNIWVGGGA